jgi:broad specificity phosphatase PhoE
MTENTNTARIYLIRHATPDWNRKDIPYDIPPGPPLVEQGELEAARLGEFIRQTGIVKLYHSPLERAKRTASIGAAIAGIGIEEQPAIAEWRSAEGDQQIAERFLPVWERVIIESAAQGPIGLVTHGGPIRFMLEKLGLPAPVMEAHRKLYDHGNPLPPAGAWLAEKSEGSEAWNFSLVFTP